MYPFIISYDLLISFFVLGVLRFYVILKFYTVSSTHSCCYTYLFWFYYNTRFNQGLLIYDIYAEEKIFQVFEDCDLTTLYVSIHAIKNCFVPLENGKGLEEKNLLTQDSGNLVPSVDMVFPVPPYHPVSSYSLGFVPYLPFVPVSLLRVPVYRVVPLVSNHSIPPESVPIPPSFGP